MKGNLTPFFAAATAEANCKFPVIPPSGNTCEFKIQRRVRIRWYFLTPY